MKMRKFPLYCLALMLAATLLSSSAVAQVPDEFVLRSSATNVKLGDNVTISVAGHALTDLYAAGMELTYDAQLLEYTGYSSSLSNQAIVLEPKVQGNKIRLLFTLTGNKPGITGDKDLFTLSFKASRVGTASVSLSSLTPVNSEPRKTIGNIGSGITMSVIQSNSRSRSSHYSAPNACSQEASTPLSRSSQGTSALFFDIWSATNGVACINVGSNDLLEAGNNSKDSSVTIKVNTGLDVNKIQLNLPAYQLQQLSSEPGKVKMVRIETDFASVSIHRDVLDGSVLSEISNLQLQIAKADPASYSQDVRAKIGNSVINELQLSLDGSPITSFNKNRVAVEVLYTLLANENPNQVVLYHISDDGKLDVVRNGYYNPAAGKVQFHPARFGMYAANHVQVSFNDMDGHTWANDAVLGLAAREVVNGRSEGRFTPDGEVTRAEFVKMLMQLFDLEDSSAMASFTDAAPGAWYYNSIASAQKTGLVQGKEDGSFGVNDPITREDMAVLIYRVSRIISSAAVQANGTTGDFLDQDRISAYAKDAVLFAKQTGLMDGVAEGHFEPKGVSTRAQAATVIYRLYQAGK
ncbi:S-layer homology domain-containing protein [Paenibacillus sp. OAS669]|uniref:S-layer homology domain-containing protein n=1 Tax=Paenibacillus sp. OAS669 TaxID=2663821 RepID=UPI0017892A44|nr:S-layer homology domain-containing protein [Paenibacillus sp. OAS669]MBE1440877.1 endo-1,4-beta-xylanase [Paenibacillus sp. OAS669]